MHITRTIDIAGTPEEAIATVMRKMLSLKWDIEASAPFWVKAKSGDWWEKKVEVEVVVSGPKNAVTAMIDAEPVSAFPVGPAWRRMVQKAVDELAHALGAPTKPLSPNTSTVQAVKVPLPSVTPDRQEWKGMSDAIDESAPYPAKFPRESILPHTTQRGGRSELVERAGQALWWLIKEVGSAIVAIGVGKSLEGQDSDVTTQKGKLEYQPSSNTMLIRWVDGSTTLAPKEYQPGYRPGR